MTKLRYPKSRNRSPLISLLLILFLTITLFLSVDLVKKAQVFLSEALGESANIVVDPTINLGPVIPFWQAVAQGGEDKEPLQNIATQTSELQLRYIRIDHIYDFYDVVSRDEDGLKFNWIKLDRVVDDILSTGAKPFFSLSYMPPAISKSEIIDPPTDWRDWQLVVQKTIEHYSGKEVKNLSGLYYEVWNEPDLFGNWKIGGQKDYLKLYAYAARGADLAQNTNPFKIGGPGSTAPYKIWASDFLDYLRENNLRIDFYSWHRYSENPKSFLDDINQVDDWLFKKGEVNLEKIVSEWSSDSENSYRHDTNFDAAHFAAVTRLLIQRVDLIFTFELKDGLSPKGEKYWGRWGILTHEGKGEVEKKPKYFALQMMNKMTGNRIALEGEGTWVTGFAVKESGRIKVILTNFDKNERHAETVPLTIQNLANGTYFYHEDYLIGPKNYSTEVIAEGTLKKEFPLSPNNFLIITLEKIL